MPELLLHPTLQNFQEYVKTLEEERGFTEQTSLQILLLLGEEVGELFRAVRKRENIAFSAQTTSANLEEELADVFIYLLSIANRYQLDLESAFRLKEEQNKKRVWEKNPKNHNS